MNRCSIGLAALVVLLGAGLANGQTVPAGFDLFTTTPGTAFDPDGPGAIPPVPFLGVPIGTFDFGGGPVAVGTTDTIVERLAPAAGPGIDTIPIEMVSLQLVSAVPVPLGLFGGTGTDFVGVTLSSDRGRHVLDPPTGAASAGSMDINFGTHTFDSLIGLEFDLREGGVFGPILPLGAGLMDLLVNEDPIVWAESLSGGYFFAPDAIERSNLIPPISFHKFTITRGGGGGDDPLQIPGVNDGFFPLVIQIVPEPTTFLIWSLLGGLGLGCRWRRRK